MRKSAPTERVRAGAVADSWMAALFAEVGRLALLSGPEKFLRERGYRRIAGTDEVGRGCLAGPVVAAAVILPEGFWWPGVDDSKKLDAAERVEVAAELRRRSVAYSISVVSAREIEETDIRRASLSAMLRSLEALEPAPEVALTDAFVVPGYGGAQVPIVHGDALSMSIAAASILAKVHRDQLMDDLAIRYPAYSFEKHKGYAVAEHREVLLRVGPCPEHRMTFHGVLPETEIC